MCPNGISGGKHPFTVGKQIELIKWLAIHKSGYGLQYLMDEWTNCCDFCWESFEYESEDTDFEESLAGLVNILLIKNKKERIYGSDGKDEKTEVIGNKFQNKELLSESEVE